MLRVQCVQEARADQTRPDKARGADQARADQAKGIRGKGKRDRQGTGIRGQRYSRLLVNFRLIRFT